MTLLNYIITLLNYMVALLLHLLNLRGVSTKLNKYIIFTMQTYKELRNFQQFS